MNTKEIIIDMLGQRSTGIIIAVWFLILIAAGCSKKNHTGAEQNQSILSSGEWKISTVMVDNTDQTAMYTGMTLSFTSSAYSTTNGKVVWPASGTWSFATSEGKVIKRDDGIDVTITEITNSKLVLALDWAKTTFGGRTSSVSGHHVFTFKK